jgi:4-hydroxy-tetrahydrodipicolinate synthase
MQVSESLYRIGRHHSALIKGLKCALSLSGICDDFLAEPFQRFLDPERNRVREALDHLHPLLNS